METPSGDIIYDFGDEPPQSPSVQFLIENVANVELGDHPVRLTLSLDALPSLPPLPDGSSLRNSGRTRRSLFGGELAPKKVSSADPDFEPSGVMRRSKSDFGTGAKLSQIRKCPESNLESPGTKRFMLCGSMDSLPLEYTSSQIQISVTPADEPENIAPQQTSSSVKLPPLKDKPYFDKRLNNLDKSVSSPTKGALSPRGKRKPSLKPLVIPSPTIKKSTSNSQLNGIMEIPHETAPFEFGCPYGPKLPLHEPPLIGSLHHELKGGLQFIKPGVVSQLLSGEIKLLSKFLIVDCRWDYEFTGGHISPALNIFREEDMVSFFFDNPPKLAFEEKIILIFHCEFSSHRAPKMCQALRNRDRQLNAHQYPKLFYPELYVIEGGYKAFFEGHKPNCEPQQYITMDDPNFAAEAKKFNVLLHKKALGKPKRSMSSNCIFSLTRKG